jgi:hypothetical protein
VAGYRVLIDDNFHYMDESDRSELGVFATADEAIAACKRIVDDFLQSRYKPGMSAEAMYDNYESFGDDPFIAPVDPKDPPVAFSAWAYARERSVILAAAMR